MAIEMKVDMLQLFSQWANFTGEKGPKNYWGSFLTYTYSFGKSLPSLNFPSKSFSKIIRSKKKCLTFIESNTDVEKSEILHIWYVCDVENVAIYDKISAYVMTSVQKMVESESGQIVF